MRASPPVHALEHFLHGAPGAGRIAIQPHERRIREQALESLLDALGALADRMECLRAIAADHRHFGVRAAVVAAQLRRTTMQGHARIAMRAARHPSARVAEQARSIAAPIQEHDHLSPAAKVPFDGGHGRLGQPLIARVLAQIDEIHTRRPRAAGTLRQHQLRVTTLRDILQSLERRGGGTQDDGHTRALRAPHGEIARRVTEAFVLFIRGVVLLVDDDEPELLEGREYRGASADDDPRAAAVGAAPRIAARAHGETRVHDRDARAEAPLKALDQLWRQGDFRHQHQRLAAAPERRANHPQIHLRLAAARHSVQKVRRKASERRLDGADHLGLCLGECHLACVALEGGRSRGLRVGRDPTPVRQGLSVRGAEVRDVFPRRAAALLQPLEQGALSRRAPGGSAFEREPSRLGQHPALRHRVRRLTRANAARQCRRHDLSDRMVVVLGCPAQEVESDPVEHRTLVENFQGSLELRCRDRRGLGDSHQHPDHLSTAERYAHPHAKLEVSRRPDRLGREVVEYSSQGSVQCYLQNQAFALVHKNCG